MKVMIVDDEPKVREGLTRLIPWEAYGYMIAGTAANGFEALEKYDELRPDLVVADIRMPGMDGLQLIQKLRERDTRLHMIILSGYADFDYAKKAINQRVDGYLLKPVDEDELITYLESIRLKWEAEQEKLEWEDSTTIRQCGWLIEALLSGSKEDADTFLGQASSCGFDWKEYQVLLLDLYPSGEGNPLEMEEAAEEIRVYFEDGGSGISFHLHSYLGIVLKRPILGEQMKRELMQELDTVLTGLCVEFTAALGTIVRDLKDIPASYEQARELLRSEFFIVGLPVLSPDNLNQITPLETEAAAELSSIEDRLYYAVDLGDSEPVANLLRTLGRTLAAEGRTEQQVKRYFAELITDLLSKLAMRNSDLDGLQRKYAESVSKLYQQRSLEQLIRHAGHILTEVSRHIDRSQQQDIKIMLDMIHRNYADNLKLETLAGVFNYNNAYLGKLFKNVTGQYFNTYLDQVRMEHAKRMLQEGLKVYQVAERVGYTNVDYFHSKFKKYVGTSPSVYRKETEPVRIKETHPISI